MADLEEYKQLDERAKTDAEATTAKGEDPLACAAIIEEIMAD